MKSIWIGKRMPANGDALRSICLLYTLFFQKDKWHSMNQTPNKGPIHFLERRSIKHNKKQFLHILPTKVSNIHKWITHEELKNQINSKRIQDARKDIFI